MNAPTLSYRYAGAADVDAVVDLVQSAYRGESSRVGWTTEADLLEGRRIDADMLRALLDEPDACVLLAHESGQLQACCELRRPADPATDPAGPAGTPAPGTAYFGMFAVRPVLQDRGYGRLVLAEAERIAAAFGADAMEMTVIDRRVELIAWYERRGYARTGRTRPFPHGDDRFGRSDLDDLQFVVLRKPLSA